MSDKNTFQEMCSDELNKLLDQENLYNNSDVWNKLNKTIKLQKLNLFSEQYGEKNKYSEIDIVKLKSFFSDCLEKKKLQKNKDVVYDRDKGIVMDVPGLHHQPHSQHTFTLRILDQTKRVSTLKSLAPIRSSIVKISDTEKSIDSK
jgi:hypothetical protein